MRFSRSLLTLAVVGAAACGPTYVVQGPPAPQRVPAPPRVPPLQVNIVRPEEGRVLVQTSRAAYLAVFEIVPGRGVALVYPAPFRARDITTSGLTWVNVYWTMRYDYSRRFASSDTRYIYALASDTPLRLSDEDYDRGHLQRVLGSAYWSESPNVTVRAIASAYLRSQPDEWWGEDMYSMALTNPRVNVTIRLARVYCPGGVYFEVRDDLADNVWCPSRQSGRPTRGNDRPTAPEPDSVIGANGRRVGRHMNPAARTPIFRIPAATDVGQQGQPTTQTPGTQAPPNQPQDPNGRNKDHNDNGRRAHGDPRNSDPRGNGNGYGNGGRDAPATQPPTPPTPPVLPVQSDPQPQQQGQPQGQGNGNATNPGNAGNQGGSGNAAKPDQNDAASRGMAALLKRTPQKPKKDDKNAASDSTDKKKP